MGATDRDGVRSSGPQTAPPKRIKKNRTFEQSEETAVTNETKGPLSDADVRHIIALMEALERAQFDSLQLDAGNWKLTLGKGGPVSFAAAPPVKPDLQALPTPSAPQGSVAVSVQTQPTPLPPVADGD